MKNVRHLWSSVRPNGDRRPYNLNRLELRICDLVVDPIALLAISALLEARLMQMFAEPELDPLKISRISSNNLAEELVAIADKNELAVAKHSLDAELIHWQNGKKITARDWIGEIYQQVYPIAQKQGFSCFLSPLNRILRSGNQAQQWLAFYETGMEVPAIIRQEIQQIAQQESSLESQICQPNLVA